jgi:hypothetical protein
MYNAVSHRVRAKPLPAKDNVLGILRQEETAQKVAVFASKLKHWQSDTNPLTTIASVREEFQKQGLTYEDVAPVIRPHLTRHINSYETTNVLGIMQFYGVPAEVVSDTAYDNLKYRLTGCPTEDAIGGAQRMAGLFYQEPEKILKMAASEAQELLIKEKRYRDGAILGRELLDTDNFHNVAKLEINSLLGENPAEAKKASVELKLPEEVFKMYVTDFAIKALQSPLFYLHRRSTQSKIFSDFCTQTDLNGKEIRHIGITAFRASVGKLNLRRADVAARLIEIPKEEQRLIASQLCFTLYPDCNGEAIVKVARHFGLQTILANKRAILGRSNGK